MLSVFLVGAGLLLLSVTWQMNLMCKLLLIGIISDMQQFLFVLFSKLVLIYFKQNFTFYKTDKHDNKLDISCLILPLSFDHTVLWHEHAIFFKQTKGCKCSHGYTDLSGQL